MYSNPRSQFNIGFDKVVPWTCAIDGNPAPPRRFNFATGILVGVKPSVASEEAVKNQQIEAVQYETCETGRTQVASASMKPRDVQNEEPS